MDIFCDILPHVVIFGIIASQCSSLMVIFRIVSIGNNEQTRKGLSN